MHPGTYINIHDLHASDISQYLTTAKSASKHSGIWDLLIAIVPTNIFKSIADGDMLPVIFFSVFFGLGVASLGESGKIIIDFMNAVSETMFKVTNWVMKFSPIGVFGLIGMTIAEMGLKALLPLGLFVVIAYATMIIFVVVVLGIVAKIFHLRYWKTMHVVMEEIAIAFSTASSEATLPRLMAKTQKMGGRQRDCLIRYSNRLHVQPGWLGNLPSTGCLVLGAGLWHSSDDCPPDYAAGGLDDYFQRDGRGARGFVCRAAGFGINDWRTGCRADVYCRN